MRPGSPIEALAAALHHAAHVALPLFEHETLDYAALAAEREAALRERRPAKPMNQMPRVLARRRPLPDECRVLGMFPQTWGSTSMGFGGMGGAAMTPAYTTLIEGPAGDIAVYWAGRFAYLVPARGPSESQQARWRADVSHNLTAPRKDALSAYGAVLTDAWN